MEYQIRKVSVATSSFVFLLSQRILSQFLKLKPHRSWYFYTVLLTAISQTMFSVESGKAVNFFAIKIFHWRIERNSLLCDFFAKFIGFLNIYYITLFGKIYDLKLIGDKLAFIEIDFILILTCTARRQIDHTQWFRL